MAGPYDHAEEFSTLSVDENGNFTVTFTDTDHSITFNSSVLDGRLNPHGNDWHYYEADLTIQRETLDYIGSANDLNISTDNVIDAIFQQSAPELRDVIGLVGPNSMPSNGGTTDTALAGYVSHLVNTDGTVVVNVTEGWHPLAPGVVVKSYVVKPNGDIVVQSVGLGNSWVGDNFFGKLASAINIAAGKVLFGDSANITMQALVNARPPECFGPYTAIDMWPLDPEFAPDPSNLNRVFDQNAVRSKIWKKPIAMIRKGDTVVSFDKHDNLVPGTVTRTFENESKILLDYFGTRVTPGHVYFRPDSKKADKFECLIDILRDDGMIQNVEGKNIRAATNVPVGDPRDGFVWAITQERRDGILIEKERGRIRLGTRFIVDGKTSQCVADVIAAKGGIVGNDELIRIGDADPTTFVWEQDAALPKPEDFVLQASGTTVEDIYKAGEWESRRPHMPAPTVMDGGPVQPLSPTALSAMPRNQSLHLELTARPDVKHTARQPMKHKLRNAMEAVQRRAAKAHKRLVS